MRFSGSIYKDGKFWLAEIPILDLMTQGKTKKEAYEMLSDMLESLVVIVNTRVTELRWLILHHSKSHDFYHRPATGFRSSFSEQCREV